MRGIKTTRGFRKDYKKLKKSGRHDLSKINIVMDFLIEGITLPRIYRDHSLQGDWSGFRDCHIESDWVLIYRIEFDNFDNETVVFCATGSHAEIFG